MKRLFIKTGLYLLFLSVLIIAAAIATLQTSTVKGWLISFVNEELQDRTGWTIETDKLQGLLPFHLHTDHASLSLNGKKWVEVESLNLSLSLSSILLKKPIFSHATAKTVKIHGPPVLAPRKPKVRPFPQLSIRHLQVEQLELPEAAPPLKVEGSLRLRGWRRDLLASFRIETDHQIATETKLYAFIAKDTTITGTIDTKVYLPLYPLARISHRLSEKSSRCIENKSNATPYSPFPEIGEKCGFTLNTHYRVSPEKDIYLHKLSLKGKGVIVNGQCSLDSTGKILDNEFNITAKTTQGQASGQLTLAKTIQAPEILLKLASDKIQTDTFTAKTITFSANATINEKGLSGNLSSAMTWEEMPLSFGSNFFLENMQTLKVSDISLQLPKAKFKGETNILFPSGVINGFLKGIADDLSLFAPAIGYALSGRSEIKCFFRPQVAAQSKQPVQGLEIQVKGIDAQIGSLKAQLISIAGEISDIRGLARGSLKVSANEGTIQNWPFSELSAATSPDLEKQQWPFDIKADDKITQRYQLSSSGHWHVSSKQIDISINTLKGTAFSQNFTLEDPVKIMARTRISHRLSEKAEQSVTSSSSSIPLALSNGQCSRYIENKSDATSHSSFPKIGEKCVEKDHWSLSPLRLTLSKAKEKERSGMFFVEASNKKGLLQATATMKDFQLDFIHMIFPKLPLTGIASGELQLSGDHNKLQGKTELTLQKVKFLEKALAHLPPLSGSLQMTLKDDHLLISTALSEADKQAAKIRADLPVVVLKDPLTIEVDPKGPLIADIHAHGQVAPMLQLFVTDTTRIRGALDIQISLSGTFNDPYVTGHIDLANGSYESLHAGSALRDIHAKLIGEGKTLTLSEFSATDGKDGTIAATGNIALDIHEDYPFDIKFKTNKAALLQQDYASATLDGVHRLSGTIQKGKLEGTLLLRDAKFSFPKSSSDAIPSVEVRYINQPSYEPPPTIPSPKTIQYPLTLDLDLQIPQPAKLSGRGLQSWWKGEVNIQGTAEEPLLYGKLKLDRGEFLFSGRPFIITEGILNFDGIPKEQTNIHLVGTLEIPETTITVTVHGKLSQPTITFVSSPPMAEKDILSWVLFDRPVSELSPLQGVQLAQTIFALRGDSTIDLLGNIRRSIGLDRLDIGSEQRDGVNEVSVKVGKYISKGIFVSVNKAINAETNRAAIEANVSKNLRVQAETGDDAETKILLKWKKDY